MLLFQKMKITDIGAVLPKISSSNEKCIRKLSLLFGSTEKNKFETRMFKTISSPSDVWLLGAVFQPH